LGSKRPDFLKHCPGKCGTMLLTFRTRNAPSWPSSRPEGSGSCTGTHAEEGRPENGKAVTANHGSEISASLICAPRCAANVAWGLPARSVPREVGQYEER
jgi:hypothetical protein